MTPIPKDDLKKRERRDLIFGQTGGEFHAAKAEKVKHVLEDLNRKFQEEDVARHAKSAGLPYFKLVGFPTDQAAITTVTEKQAREAMAVPFYRDGNHLKVGVVDPKNPQLNELISFLEKKNYAVETYIVSGYGFEKAMERFNSIRAPKVEQENVKIDESDTGFSRELKELSDMGSSINKLSPTQLISQLLSGAVSTRASDIHLQPEKDYLEIRYRVDGVLQEATRLDRSAYQPLVSRIKILSKLKINVTNKPQDGSFVIQTPMHTFEIRVSFLPSAYGEAIVLRLLGEQVALNIADIGMRKLAYKQVSEEINKPNGLILTTGPTGSGKTTTLYSFLKTVNKPGVKIITLENPIEYRLEGVEQIQIDEKAGLTFASALKSTLRQDPDVLMVGEIRDFDTAEAAAQAALTGHLVFSTLHTNDASGAIPRFLNLGIKPVVLAPALSTVIAQRLVRKLCQDCKEVQKLDDQTMSRAKHILSEIPKNSEEVLPDKLVFYHSKGCGKCNHLGYKGRIGVFELFIVDDEMQQLIFKESSTVQIKDLAVKKGMISMIQDGLLKALEGVTDVSEVFRVTEE